MAEREVNFEKFCPDCKYYLTDNWEDPCDICLENPSNEDSRKPTEFVEKE